LKIANMSIYVNVTIVMTCREYKCYSDE